MMFEDTLGYSQRLITGTESAQREYIIRKIQNRNMVSELERPQKPHQDNVYLERSEL